jgi:hypothetical protein
MATALTFAAGLQGLVSSTTVGQVCTEVDDHLATTKDVDVQVTVVGAASGTLTDKIVDVYCLTSLDGTSYDGDTSYSGANGSYTMAAANSQNPKRLGSLWIYALGGTARGSWSLFDRLGFRPLWWSILIVNHTGIALAASGNGASYDFPVV